MLIFVADTCSMSSSAAIADDTRTIAQFTVNHKKTHSEKIMPQIEALFKAADIMPEAIDAFAAASGPGSFTGVRIGVATVKAFAQVLGKPCISVSSIEALAYSALPFKGIVSPILDARRNQTYNALFASDGREIKRLCEDRAIALAELLETLKKSGENVIFTGDGAPVFSEQIKQELGDRAYFMPKPFVYNLASTVAEIGIKKLNAGEILTPDKLIPEYIRLSQAEREKMEKEIQADENKRI